MPAQGISTPDLAQAITNLETALTDFRQAMRATPLPRPAGSAIFNALREWRTGEARAKQLPPYVIATDAVLRAIESANPTTVDELAAVRGFGATKAANYGDAVLAVLATTPPDEKVAVSAA